MSSLNEYGIIPECDIARADELARTALAAYLGIKGGGNG